MNKKNEQGIRRIVLVVFAVLSLSLIASGFYLSRNLPRLVKQAVETYTPKTTGTPVKLGAVHFNFITGTVTLKKFVIANPSGYKTDHAFQFDRLTFQIALPTLFKKTIVIRKFNIDHVSIIAEQKGAIVRTNLQEIAEHADGVSLVKTKKSQSAVRQKLIVSKLVFTDNTVDLVSETMGSRKIRLPDIVLTDIGKKEDGLTIDQMTQRITQLVTTQISDVLKEELKRTARKKTEQAVTDKIKSWLSK